MNDERRLLDADATHIERLILESSEEDRPPADGRRRLLEALGAAGVVTLGSLAHAGIELASPPAADAAGLAATQTSTTAIGASKAGIVVLAKWVGIGLLSGTIVSGAASFVAHPQNGTREPSDESTTAILQTGRSANGVEKPTRRTDTTGSEIVPSPSSAEMRGTPHPSAEVPADQGLARELELLDAARTSLLSGNPQQTLEILNRRDREFGPGTLDAEASVLRCEALAHAGRKDLAVAVCTAFLNANPSSPLEPRVRTVLNTLAAHPSAHSIPTGTPPKSATYPPVSEELPTEGSPRNVGRFPLE